MDAPDGTRIYAFGEFRLHVARQALHHAAEDRWIPLTPRVFDTLLFLVEHPGELLDKARMMAAVWPDVVVEENNLDQNISTLRRLLGERRGEPRYIATLRRRGYRFVAPVRQIAAAELEGSGRPGGNGGKTEETAALPDRAINTRSRVKLRASPGWRRRHSPSSPYSCSGTTTGNRRRWILRHGPSRCCRSGRWPLPTATNPWSSEWPSR